MFETNLHLRSIIPLKHFHVHTTSEICHSVKHQNVNVLKLKKKEERQIDINL